MQCGCRRDATRFVCTDKGRVAMFPLLITGAECFILNNYVIWASIYAKKGGM